MSFPGSAVCSRGIIVVYPIPKNANSKRCQDRFLLSWEYNNAINSILLPKLFGPTVRKNCSSDQEKLWKFEAEC